MELTIIELFRAVLIFVGYVVGVGFIVAGIVDIINVCKTRKGIAKKEGE